MMVQWQDGRDELWRQGYAVVPDLALPAELLDELREWLVGPGGGWAGGLIRLRLRDAITAPALTTPPLLDVLPSLGFKKPKLHSFYASVLLPGAGGLTWRRDVNYAWDRAFPPELFMMYYLQDTGPGNGCLRVVPHSHRPEHSHPDTGWLPPRPLPDLLEQACDVPLQAGQLLVGDRRLLHATHANDSDQPCTAITIAWAPDFGNLPEPVQALIASNSCLPQRGWWDNPPAWLTPPLTDLLPIYRGTAKPAAIIKADA